MIWPDTDLYDKLRFASAAYDIRSAIEACDDREAQEFSMGETGEIISDMLPKLCLTTGAFVLPGGGGKPLRIMRDVSF